MSQPMDYAVLTGPITGTLTLPDGSTVDVTDPEVEARDAEHAAAIAHAIGLHHAEHGHPDHDPADPFVYTPPKPKRKR